MTRGTLQTGQSISPCCVISIFFFLGADASALNEMGGVQGNEGWGNTPPCSARRLCGDESDGALQLMSYPVLQLETQALERFQLVLSCGVTTIVDHPVQPAVFLLQTFKMAVHLCPPLRDKHRPHPMIAQIELIGSF